MSWIKCCDKLPEDQQVVLIYSYKEGTSCPLIINALFESSAHGWRDVKSGKPKPMWWASNDGWGYTVSRHPTHWMPLPDEPKPDAGGFANAQEGSERILRE